MYSLFMCVFIYIQGINFMTFVIITDVTDVTDVIIVAKPSNEKTAKDIIVKFFT